MTLSFIICNLIIYLVLGFLPLVFTNVASSSSKSDLCVLVICLFSSMTLVTHH